MNAQILLLGNGVNAVKNSYYWSDLINDLTRFLDLPPISPNSEKQFPLLYEQIFLTNLKNKKYEETKIKTFIAEKTEKIAPNALHDRIKTMHFSDIITTNYDYVIEKAFGISSKDIANKGVVKESSYSLFRHTEIGKKRIWHAHGEIMSPKSILLGFEHYGGQLQHMRNYIVSGVRDTYKNFRSEPLITHIKKGNVQNNSWLDLFFLNDISIVGLTLDFIETDLWWLITYRARMKLTQQIPIRNSITYYYPNNLGKSNEFKIEMLNANEVKTKPLKSDHNEDFYYQVFDDIEREISK